MIKYIIHTISSYNDYYGNSYHFSRITSTKTGKSLVVDVSSVSNVQHLLFRRNENSKPIVTNPREIYSVQSWEKKREWERKRKSAGKFVRRYYEGDVTATMNRRLNRKDNPRNRDLRVA